MGRMSHDRVRFFLHHRYFQAHEKPNGMSRTTCLNILEEVFDLCPKTARRTMERNNRGFWIVCRPSQFARFIIARCDAAECVNGVRDLQPALFVPSDEVSTIREGLRDQGRGVSVVDIRAVLDYLHSYELIDEQCGDTVIDVSGNPHRRQS